MASEGASVRIISERQLAERFDEIFEELRSQKQTALISRHGKLMARLVPVDDERVLLNNAFATLVKDLSSARELDDQPSYPLEELKK